MRLRRMALRLSALRGVGLLELHPGRVKKD